MLDPLVAAIFGGRGSLASAIFPAFVWPVAGWSSWLGAHHPLYEPTFAGVWDQDPHRSNHASSLPCVLAGSFLGILTGVSGPAVKDVP